MTQLWLPEEKQLLDLPLDALQPDAPRLAQREPALKLEALAAPLHDPLRLAARREDAPLAAPLRDNGEIIDFESPGW